MSFNNQKQLLKTTYFFIFLPFYMGRPMHQSWIMIQNCESNISSTTLVSKTNWCSSTWQSSFALGLVVRFPLQFAGTDHTHFSWQWFTHIQTVKSKYEWQMSLRREFRHLSFFLHPFHFFVLTFTFLPNFHFSLSQVEPGSGFSPRLGWSPQISPSSPPRLLHPLLSTDI